MFRSLPVVAVIRPNDAESKVVLPTTKFGLFNIFMNVVFSSNLTRSVIGIRFVRLMSMLK
jgi:hypothetical protein